MTPQTPAVGIASNLMPGFEARRLEVDGIGLHVAVGGSGPPLMLVHGAPQSHIMWRHVAPILAEKFTLILPDLRGYGRSDKPHGADYSKRRSAADLVAVARQLGFETFRLAGHDRGARVSRRLAKDHRDCIEQLAILDIVPTAHVYAATNRRLAHSMWHWFVFPLPEPMPENLMGPQAGEFIRQLCGGMAGADDAALQDYLATNATPEAFHAMCQDYRAGAGIDLKHDAADADQPITVPTLVLWGEKSPSTGGSFDVEAAWRPEASDLRFASLPCGHFVPEECPLETADALLGFFQ
jgi:haloacetate dehalogenase